MLNKITYIAIACLIPGLSFAGPPAGQVSINPVCSNSDCRGAIQLEGCDKNTITDNLGVTCFLNPNFKQNQVKM